MSGSESQRASRLKDRIKARLGLAASASVPSGGAERAGEALARQRQKLKRIRRQIEREEEALAQLRERVAEVREGVSFPPGPLTGGTPVFFLTGRAKSGTSWLMRMLDSHPEVLCKGEGRFFGRDYMRDSKGGGNPQFRSLYGAITDSELLRFWVEKSVWTRGENVEEHLARITGLATEYFLKQRLSETTKRIVGDKTPFTGRDVVREVAEICPGARLIHIIRDGRDVAISSIHHVWNHVKQEGGIHELNREQLEKRDAYRADPAAFMKSGQSIFTRGQLAHLAEDWAETVGRAIEDGPALLGENYIEVRYEDLLEAPEKEARRLFEFLGADAGERVVERCVEKASFEKRAGGRQRGQEDSASFLRKGIAGDWKNVFTDEDGSIFKRVAGDTLIRLGYEQGHDW